MDHVDSVDVVGKSTQNFLRYIQFMAPSHSSNKVVYFLLLITDGVIKIDPTDLAGRKGVFDFLLSHLQSCSYFSTAETLTSFTLNFSVQYGYP